MVKFLINDRDNPGSIISSLAAALKPTNHA